MKVVSLFNGMGCIWLALDELGIEVTARYSSEVDKYAIKANDTLYPDTVQLGDVRNVNGSDLGFIDLLAGGSPCQSFSFAGKRNGMSTKCETEILTLDHYLQLKSEGYEFEGQSYLFWEYMRILNELREINPNILFLLENVEMGERWEKVLSKAIGVNGIHINSALVSAQNRQRIYWTNIGLKPQGLFGDLLPTIQQPKDEGILLKHILESDVDEKYYLSEKMVIKLIDWETRNKLNGNGFKVEYRGVDDKSTSIPTGPLKSSSTFLKIDKQGNPKNNQDKAGCLTAGGHSGGNHSDMDLICTTGVLKFGRTDEAKEIRKESMKNGKDYTPFRGKEITAIDTDKTNCLTSATKDNLIVHNTMPRRSTSGKGGTGPLSRTYGKTYCLDTGNTNVIQLNLSIESGGKQPYQQNRMYSIDGQSPALCRDKADLIINTTRIRRLTPTECLRLQTVPEWAINKLLNSGIRDTQLYKMTGNGWTIKAISHILKSI